MRDFTFSRSETTQVFFDEVVSFRGDKVVIFIDNNLLHILDNLILKKYFCASKVLDIKKIDVTEGIKSINYLDYILKSLPVMDKRTIMVAIGGGVLGDFVGFLSSILLRGCRYVSFPSTLLAMVDSCFGGKTALNFGGIKNQIGSFKNPEKIIFEFGLLQNIPDRVFCDGFAEIIKYGCIYDEKILNYLDEHCSLMKRNNNKVLNAIVKQSIDAKYSFVKSDLLDNKERNILNFGHTFGHAIESVSGYKISHGQAVAIGMIMAAEYSFFYDFCEEYVVNKIKKIISKFFDLDLLFNKVSSFEIEKIVSYMYNDKKQIDKKLNLILIKNFGDCFIQPIDNESDIKIFLKNFINNTKCTFHI